MSTPEPTRPEQIRPEQMREADRKSTRLNSSHSQISYAVFCLKKKSANLWKYHQRERRNVERALSSLCSRVDSAASCQADTLKTAPRAAPLMDAHTHKRYLDF